MCWTVMKKKKKKKYIILNVLPFGVKYHLEIHSYTVRACGFLLILPCVENISYEEIFKYPIQGGYIMLQNRLLVKNMTQISKKVTIA